MAVMVIGIGDFARSALLVDGTGEGNGDLGRSAVAATGAGDFARSAALASLGDLGVGVTAEAV